MLLDSSAGQVGISAIVGIALLIVMITWWKLHPFVALLISAVAIGLGSGLDPVKAVSSFSTGFGNTMASVGILVGLGAMFGKLLADSGGAGRIVDTLVGSASPRALPWVMALAGAIIGLPMFFEVGLVLLAPVILLAAHRSKAPIMRIAIPALAGLSTMHALVPPHPGPLAALSNFPGASLGLTLGVGVLVAIPTVIVAGPLFGAVASRMVPAPAPADAVASLSEPGIGSDGAGRRRPSFFSAIACVLLPVVLMLANAIVEIVAPGATGQIVDILAFIGTPTVAIALGLIVAMFWLGSGTGMKWGLVQKSLGSGLPGIASILLIVGAGGGLKQVLIDTGIGTIIADFARGSGLSLVLLAWLIAALIRVAVGSATVSIVTTAGILAPAAAGMPSLGLTLLVLAIGAGSVFLSHVNDAGFWLVKEYFGLSVGQTVKTWSLMECIVSVVPMVPILAISLFV